jgi:iron complex transport system ATP-binding protein
MVDIEKKLQQRILMGKADQIILQGSGLKLGYHSGKKLTEVARDISFELKKGELTCLLGPNGVGKSTLLKAIMGQNPPLEGELLFQGHPLNSFNQKELARKIAVVLTEKITTANLTVGQLVALGRTPHTGWLGNLSEADKAIVENAIQATKTGYLHDRRLSELSDGQLQKVMVARALAQDGELMILDEPTAHLDLVNRYEIMHLLQEIARSKQKAILVVTHDLEIAIDTADQFWIMQCGMPLVSGLPEDLILQGKIDLLLQNEQLKFNTKSGKVQLRYEADPIPVTGPEELAQWVRLALRKNLEKTDYSGVSIDISTNPITFKIISQKSEQSFQTIEEVIRAIKI